MQLLPIGSLGFVSGKMQVDAHYGSTEDHVESRKSRIDVVGNSQAPNECMRLVQVVAQSCKES